MIRRFSLLIAGLMLALPAVAAGTSETLQEVPADRMQPVKARIDWSLLPHGAYDYDVERGGTSILNEGAFPATTIVPVKFKMPAVDGNGFYFSCGVFFLMPADKPRFVPTIGSGWTEAQQCTGLKELDLTPQAPKIAKLVLVYDAMLPDGQIAQPVVFTWDNSLPGYTLDEAVSRAASVQK